jgi:hypothetical protein
MEQHISLWIVNSVSLKHYKNTTQCVGLAQKRFQCGTCTKEISASSHQKVACSRQDRDEKLST